MFIKLAQLVPHPHSSGRFTRYFDRLHDFSVAIPRYYKDVYVKSFFSGKARLLNSVPMECFYWPMTSLWRGSVKDWNFCPSIFVWKKKLACPFFFKDMHVFKGRKLEQLPPLYHWSTEAHLLWAYGCSFEAISLRILSTTGLCLVSEDCTNNLGQNILGKFWKLTH